MSMPLQHCMVSDLESHKNMLICDCVALLGNIACGVLQCKT